MLDGYFNWLVHLVLAENHSKLLYILHSREYRWKVKFDDNLVAHGLALRERYFKPEELPMNDVTLLEVLVSMAERIDSHIMYDYKYGNRTHLWFEQMLKNLDIFKFSDDSEWINQDEWERDVNSKIDILLDRTYKPDGTYGGLFPLDTPPKDLRKVQLWTHAQLYFNEKGDIYE